MKRERRWIARAGGERCLVGPITGRSQRQRADLPPEQRGPVPGAYGAQLITRKGVFGIIQGHQNPHLAVDPNTGALFVGVGSAGNIGVEPEPKATIQRFDASRSGGGPRRHLADAAPEWCFARRGRVRPHDRRRPALPDDHCAMTRQCGCNHSGSECQQA